MTVVGVVMSDKEYITPAVMIDGQSVPVEGWMLVLAFAMRGIPWAVEQATDPEFDLRGRMKYYYKRKDTYWFENHIARLEKELKDAKEQLCKLNK